MKQPEPIEKLLQDLQSPHSYDRLVAAFELRRRAPAEPRTLDALRAAAATDADTAVRSAAAKSYRDLTDAQQPQSSMETAATMTATPTTHSGRAGSKVSVHKSLSLFRRAHSGAFPAQIGRNRARKGRKNIWQPTKVFVLAAFFSFVLNLVVLLAIAWWGVHLTHIQGLIVAVLVVLATNLLLVIQITRGRQYPLAAGIVVGGVLVALILLTFGQLLIAMLAYIATGY